MDGHDPKCATFRALPTKEANFISWNGNAAKLDIREWHPNHERCGKGITLTEDEGRNLYDALKAIYEKE